MDVSAQICDQKDIFQFNDLKHFKVRGLADDCKLAIHHNTDLQTTIFPKAPQQQKDSLQYPKICTDAQVQCQSQSNTKINGLRISQSLLTDNYKVTVDCLNQMLKAIKSLFHQINSLRLNSTNSYQAHIFFNHTIQRGITEISELSNISQDQSKNYNRLFEKIDRVKKYMCAFNSRNVVKTQVPAPLRPEQIYLSKIFRV